MYLNGLIDFPTFQRLHNATRANRSLLITNAHGVLVETLPPLGTFDMRNSAMRELFVSDAVYGVESGAFDGVFIDRANWASRGLLQITNGTVLSRHEWRASLLGCVWTHCHTAVKYPCSSGGNF
jgi:hypothetical protein